MNVVKSYVRGLYLWGVIFVRELPKLLNPWDREIKVSTALKLEEYPNINCIEKQKNKYGLGKSCTMGEMCNSARSGIWATLFMVKC